MTCGCRLQVLRVLLKLLETSRESRTLAVAASDLGRFIAAHPHGRNIVAGEPPALSVLHCVCKRAFAAPGQTMPLCYAKSDAAHVA